MIFICIKFVRNADVSVICFAVKLHREAWRWIIFLLFIVLGFFRVVEDIVEGVGIAIWERSHGESGQKIQTVLYIVTLTERGEWERGIILSLLF